MYHLSSLVFLIYLLSISDVFTLTTTDNSFKFNTVLLLMRNSLTSCNLNKDFDLLSYVNLKVKILSFKPYFYSYSCQYHGDFCRDHWHCRCFIWGSRAGFDCGPSRCHCPSKGLSFSKGRFLQGHQRR